MPWETADRIEDLLNEHQHRYDCGADDLSVYVWFRHGMVEEIQSTAETFLQVASRILERIPLANVLSLYDIRGRGMDMATGIGSRMARRF